jgi:general secretion pathway protein G
MQSIFFNKSHGFTLLEMLVVLVIIGLLAGLVGPQIFGTTDNAKVQTAKVQIKQLKGALQTLRLNMGRLPTKEEGLSLLRNPPSEENLKPLWKGPYLEEAIPVDPWHHPYQYSIPGTEGHPFALYSFGADGQPGGADFNADIGYLPPR